MNKEEIPDTVRDLARNALEDEVVKLRREIAAISPKTPLKRPSRKLELKSVSFFLNGDLMKENASVMFDFESHMLDVRTDDGKRLVDTEVVSSSDLETVDALGFAKEK